MPVSLCAWKVKHYFLKHLILRGVENVRKSAI